MRFPRCILRFGPAVLAVFLLLACCNIDFGFNDSRTMVVQYDDLGQTIDGFGGSNAWMSLPAFASTRDQVVSLLYSRTEGIGLSILRTRIPFRENEGDHRDGFIATEADGSYTYTVLGNGAKEFSFNWSAWEIGNTRTLIQAIQGLADGPEELVVMSTPWTPPNLWKTGYPNPDLPAYGGTFDPAYYEDYADMLADYVSQYQSNMGVPLSVLAVQNEPNYVPITYESCGWTASEIRDFLQVLGSRFALKGVSESTQIMAAEDMHFEERMVLPSLDDPTANAVLDIVGVHQYDHANAGETDLAAKALPSVGDEDKPLWMTEVSTSETNDPSISDGLYWARLIHNDLTIGHVNAFLYWWLWSNGTTKGSLINLSGSSVIDNKRLYALGQYSRFIRPGWSRVGSSTEPVSGVCTSAFRDAAGSRFAVVLINQNNVLASVEVSLSGAGQLTDVGAWRTSATESLAAVEAPEPDGSDFTVEVPARSITTVTGAVE
jgi:O-glycosyl hydrolase